MERWQELADDLNETGFAREFIAQYMNRGFGTLTKREVDLLVMQLLVKYRRAWSLDRPSDYEIARQLAISPRKVRSMLDELAYRDPSKDDEWCRKQLLEILRDAEKHVDEGYVRVQIDDGLVRAYATAKIRAAMGLVDSSFNTSIVSLSGERYAALVLELIEDDRSKKLLSYLPTDVEDDQAEKSPSPIKLFIDEFAKAAGKESGSQLVKLGVTLITGGFKHAVDFVKEVFEQRAA